MGVVGLWIGLCIGLVIVAIALIAVWSMRSRRLVEELSTREAAGTRHRQSAADRHTLCL